MGLCDGVESDAGEAGGLHSAEPVNRSLSQLSVFTDLNGTYSVKVGSYHGSGSDRASQDSRLRSQKGGVEFINFPFGSFGSEICSEQLPAATARTRGQIQKSQTGSTRTQEFQESRNLIFDPNFWPYDPNRDFLFLFFPNIVHK